MPVGRYARHTLPTLRRLTRDKILYAEDIYTANRAVWNWSPAATFSPDADQVAYMDLKLPKDRIPRTAITGFPVWSMIGFAGGNIYVIYDFQFMAIDGGAAGSPTQTSHHIQAVPFAVATWFRGPEFRLNPNEIDIGLYRGNYADIQFRLRRIGTHGDDDALGTLYLFKVVFEYQAYE